MHASTKAPLAVHDNYSNRWMEDFFFWKWGNCLKQRIAVNLTTTNININIEELFYALENRPILYPNVWYLGILCLPSAHTKIWRDTLSSEVLLAWSFKQPRKVCDFLGLKNGIQKSIFVSSRMDIKVLSLPSVTRTWTLVLHIAWTFSLYRFEIFTCIEIFG